MLNRRNRVKVQRGVFYYFYISTTIFFSCLDDEELRITWTPRINSCAWFQQQRSSGCSIRFVLNWFWVNSWCYKLDTWHRSHQLHCQDVCQRPLEVASAERFEFWAEVRISQNFVFGKRTVSWSWMNKWCYELETGSGTCQGHCQEVCQVPDPASGDERLKV